MGLGDVDVHVDPDFGDDGGSLLPGNGEDAAVELAGGDDGDVVIQVPHLPHEVLQCRPRSAQDPIGRVTAAAAPVAREEARDPLLVVGTNQLRGPHESRRRASEAMVAVGGVRVRVSRLERERDPT